MKAFALTSADQPASLIDLPDPDVAEDGVLVRIRAASVNGFDVSEANGFLVAMMEHVFPTVIGRDFAGVVEAVGSQRSDVAVGDEVLGFVSSAPPLHDGSYAQTVSGGSNLVLAPKPAELSFEVASAIPLAAATRLTRWRQSMSAPVTPCSSPARPGVSARRRCSWRPNAGRT
jgi:NADPH2:quinone reductase